MKNTLFLSLILLTLFSNCKKETIPELDARSNTSDFFISGTFGTEVIDLKASGDYYMYSNYYFDSTKKTNVFTGEIKNRNQIINQPKVRLEIIDFIKYDLGIDSLLNMSILDLFDTSDPSDCLGKATIILDLNDGTGEKNSSLIAQPLNKIKVKNVEQYAMNENSQHTVRITFEGEVLLPNSSGPDEVFKFDAAFAIAYPQ